MVIKGRAGKTTRGSLWAEEEEPGQMEGPKNPKDAAELRESVPPGSAGLPKSSYYSHFSDEASEALEEVGLGWDPGVSGDNAHPSASPPFPS